MAELAQSREIVPCHPELGQHAILNPKHASKVDFHPHSGRRKRPHRSFLGSNVRGVEGHEIPLGNEHAYRLARIWEGRRILPEELLELLAVLDSNIRRGLTMPDEIRCDQGIQLESTL